MRAKVACFCAVAIVAGLSPLAHAATRKPNTYKVDRTDDPAGSGRCRRAPDDCSLRQAITKARRGDRVVLPALDAPSPTDYMLDDELMLTRPIKIIGAGADLVRVTTLRQSRIFEVTANHVRISGITITGGSLVARDGEDAWAAAQGGGDGYFEEPGAPGDDFQEVGADEMSVEGAGILNRGQLLLNQVVVESNRVLAGNGGGASAVAGAGGNAREQPGGDGGDATAIGGSGGDAMGGGIANHGSLTLKDTSVRDNEAISGDGGDAYALAGQGGYGSTANTSAGGDGGDATAKGGDGGDAVGADVFGTYTALGTTVVAPDAPTVGTDGIFGSTDGEDAQGDVGPGGTGGAAHAVFGRGWHPTPFTWQIDLLDDPGEPSRCSVDVDADCSLRSVLDHVRAGDTVRVPEGHYTLNGQLDIAKPINLVGDDPETTTIDAKGSGRVVTVNAPDGTVLIKQLTITGGVLVGGDGAPALAQGDDGTPDPIDSSLPFGESQTVVGAAGADAEGGGILNLTTLTLMDVNVTENSVQAGSGGDAYAQGGNGAPADASGSDGGDATATGGEGGDARGSGILNRGSLTLLNTVVQDNSVFAEAGDGGDAIAAGGKGGDGSSVDDIAGHDGGDALALGGDGGDATGGQIVNEGSMTIGAGCNIGGDSDPSRGKNGISSEASGANGNSDIGSGGNGGGADATPGAGGTGTV